MQLCKSFVVIFSQFIEFGAFVEFLWNVLQFDAYMVLIRCCEGTK